MLQQLYKMTKIQIWGTCDEIQEDSGNMKFYEYFGQVLYHFQN